MQNILKIMRWILAAATVGIILLLCWHCLDIYLIGNRAENINAGVYLSPVYSLQLVSARLSAVSPLLVVYLALAAVSAIAHLVWWEAPRTTGKIRPCPPVLPCRFLGAARLTILILGATFIILGAMNGGARDVLVKAINICTECIGLG